MGTIRSDSEKQARKEKKTDKYSKKRKSENDDKTVADQDESVTKPEKRSKKRKTDDGESKTADEDKPKRKSSKSKKSSESESADDEPVSKPSKSKKALDSDSEPAKSITSVDSYRISAVNKAALAAKGITELFPIQTSTFDHIFDGKDLIARAKTGSGKTLAFALPVCERLLAASQAKSSAYGRGPRVLVIAPTRELAKQVASTFEWVSQGLSTLCVYGGAPYGPQQDALRRGVDIIVGTPGRLSDFLDKKAMLKLNNLDYVILDEADEMLNDGFAKDIESILSHVGDRPTQKLLFSATIPAWVDKVAKQYLQPDRVVIDLIQTAVSTNPDIKHYSMPCFWSEKPKVIGDCIRVFGKSGRCIVFTTTKKECNEMVMDGRFNVDAQVLHGDIAQNQREITLKGFRDGKFKVLVATDVAARGLDITGVDVVIQSEPPTDHETYVHRSGRTGRAGHKGISITLYGPKTVFYMQQIEKKAKVKFQVLGCPQPQDMITVALDGVAARVHPLIKSTIPDSFLEAAKKLLAAGRTPEKVVAACLMAQCGTNVSANGIQGCSLLTGQAENATVLVTSQYPLYSASGAFAVLRRHLDQELVDGCKNLRLLADSMGAVCDLPASCRPIIEALPESSGVSLATSLPDFVEKSDGPTRQIFRGRNGGGGGGGNFGGNRNYQNKNTNRGW